MLPLLANKDEYIISSVCIHCSNQWIISW